MSRTINSKIWGTLPSGESVNLFSLKNANGMEAWISDYGCNITNLWIPTPDGTRHDVVLGFESLAEYCTTNFYFGGVIGRYANRIAKGKFELDNVTFNVAKNLQGNHLHGGIKGFDKVLWTTEMIETDEPSLILKYLSPNGEEGYPGNLETTVTYTLKSNNTLLMTFEAETDQKTIVNLTNHSYFNFSGGRENVLNYELQINAVKMLEIDSSLIPTGNMLDVSDSVFDFIEPQKMGTGIYKISDEQLRLGSGYDHCYVLNKAENEMGLVAIVSDEKTGLKLEITSTEPGVQLYSANHLPGVSGKNGISYKKHHGLCLETQHFPDAPNHPYFKSTELKPGEKFESFTSWAFSNLG
jgi:aldose 1-epimerase